MRRKILAFGGLLALAVSGCSAGHSSPPAPNPYVIPTVITPGYVNAVFAVLNHINGDAVRTLIDQQQLSKRVTADLRSIYQDPLYEVELRVFQQGLENRFANVKRRPGDRITRVDRVVWSSASCIFVATTSDLTAVEVHPGSAAASEYWRLSLKSPNDDPGHINPTPWALSDNEDFVTPTSVPNRCQ